MLAQDASSYDKTMDCKIGSDSLLAIITAY